MTIGQLAQELNIKTQTIRYYENQGLLSKPERTQSNYRIYDQNSIKRLTFIKRAKEIGFSLGDIKTLLEMSDKKVNRCADVKDFAETRLIKIRSRIEDLKSMEMTLSDIIKQCSQPNKTAECPIIESLTEG